jgi:hypothetical protein
MSAMEDVQPLLIPTLSKTKISRHLSYPVGAEKVSSALASCVQFPLLKLHFYFRFDNSLRRGEYEFLRVEYLDNVRPAQEWPIDTLYQRPPQWRCEIVVQPVPPGCPTLVLHLDVGGIPPALITLVRC